MGLELRYEYGQTPLDEDEKTGLLIPSITTRAELDEFEGSSAHRAGYVRAGASILGGASQSLNTYSTYRSSTSEPQF